MAIPLPFPTPGYEALSSTLDETRRRLVTLRATVPEPWPLRLKVYRAGADARRDAPLGELVDGTVIDTNTTVVAVLPASLAAAVFRLDGDVATRQVQTSAPYCLSGDRGGRLLPCPRLTEGQHELEIWPFAKSADATAFAADGDATNAVAAPPPVVVRFSVQGPVIVVDPPPPPAPPPTPVPLGDDGFPLAPGGKRVYVAPDGSDSADGLTTARPIATIAEALTRIDPGDRLMLLRGGSWRAAIDWPTSGTPGCPAGLFSYGDPTLPLPRLVAPAREKASAVRFITNDLHDVAVVGLDLTCEASDPADDDFRRDRPVTYGVAVRRRLRNLLVQDCVIHNFANNLVITADDRGDPQDVSRNVVYRNCRVLDAWSLTWPYAGQGIYVESVDGVTIEGCLFDRNGWHPDIPGTDPTEFRHGMYVSVHNVSNLVVTDTVVSRSAAMGIQARPGAVVRRCLGFDNCYHVLGSSQRIEVSDCAFVGGHPHLAGSLTGAGYVGIASNAGENVVRGCVFVGRADPRLTRFTGAAIEVGRRDWTPPGKQSLRADGNAVLGWPGGASRRDGKKVMLDPSAVTVPVPRDLSAVWSLEEWVEAARNDWGGAPATAAAIARVRAACGLDV